MGVIAKILDADDTHKRTFGVELLVAEQYITARLDASTNIQPIFFCPNAVKFTFEREQLARILVKEPCRFSEHIPRGSRLVRIVANIGIWQRNMENSVFVSYRQLVNVVRHGLTVNVLRDNLEPTFGVFVFHVELFANEHSRLRNDGHCFSLNKAIREV